jgi:hypothetical protein
LAEVVKIANLERFEVDFVEHRLDDRVRASDQISLADWGKNSSIPGQLMCGSLEARNKA